MYLGREEHDWLQRLKEPPMEAKTAETLKTLAVTTIKSIRQPVATLSGGQRQSVAVARAVMWNSRLVILDEPTAALGVSQTEQVLAARRALAEQGLAVILISHNLHDIFEVGDRITVLRLGRDIGVYERAKTTQEEVVHAITAGSSDQGLRHPGDRERRRRHDADATALPVEAEQQSYWERAAPQRPHGQPRQRARHRRARVRRPLLRPRPRRTASPRSTSSNLIGQLAGTCMLAYGVVFVLLIGEIDLSIGFVSGIAGVIVALLQEPTPIGPGLPGWALHHHRARSRRRRSAPSRDRSSR